MNKMRFMLFFIITLLSVSNLFASKPLSIIFKNMGEANQDTVKTWLNTNQVNGIPGTGDATGFPKYSSIKVEDADSSSDLIFTGYIRPLQPNAQLAIFSDDGCKVAITKVSDGTLISPNDNYKHGQALNSTASFKPLDFPNSAVNEIYYIEVKYSNTCYIEGGTDIDGCTLVAYAGGAEIVGLSIENPIEKQAFTDSESFDVFSHFSGTDITKLSDVKLNYTKGTTSSSVNGVLDPISNQYKFAMSSTTTTIGTYTLQISAKYNGVDITSESRTIYIVPDGNGVLVQYFDGNEITDFPNLLTETIEPKVDCSWTNFPGVSDNISLSSCVRWTGKLMSRYSEDYTLKITTSNSGNVNFYKQSNGILTKIFPTDQILISGTDNIFNLNFNANEGIYFHIQNDVDDTSDLLHELKMKWNSYHQSEEVIPSNWYIHNIQPTYNNVTPIQNSLINAPGDVNFNIVVKDNESKISIFKSIKATIMSEDIGYGFTFTQDSKYANIEMSSTGITYNNANEVKYSCMWYNLSSTRDSIHNYKIYAKLFDDLGAMTLALSTFQVDKESDSNGSGLWGTYYNTMTYSNDLFDDLVLTRKDASISFPWNNVKPPMITNDKYGVKWFGMVQPRYSEKYKFKIETKSFAKVYLTGEDGSRLVNDDLLIDKSWNNTSDIAESAPLLLDSNKRYNIIIKYYKFDSISNNNITDGSIKLYWKTVKDNGDNNTQIEEYIPSSQLFPYIPLRGHVTVPKKNNIIGIIDDNSGIPYAVIPLKTTISDDNGNSLKKLVANIKNVNGSNVNKVMDITHISQQNGYKEYDNSVNDSIILTHNDFTQLQGTYKIYEVATDTKRDVDSLIYGSDEAPVDFIIQNKPALIALNQRQEIDSADDRRQLFANIKVKAFTKFDFIEFTLVDNTINYTYYHFKDTTPSYTTNPDNSRIYNFSLPQPQSCLYNDLDLVVKVKDIHGMTTIKTYDYPTYVENDSEISSYTNDQLLQQNNVEKMDYLAGKIAPDYIVVQFCAIAETDFYWVKQVDTATGAVNYFENPILSGAAGAVPDLSVGVFAGWLSGLTLDFSSGNDVLCALNTDNALFSTVHNPTYICNFISGPTISKGFSIPPCIGINVLCTTLNGDLTFGVELGLKVGISSPIFNSNNDIQTLSNIMKKVPIPSYTYGIN